MLDRAKNIKQIATVILLIANVIVSKNVFHKNHQYQTSIAILFSSSVELVVEGVEGVVAGVNVELAVVVEDSRKLEWVVEEVVVDATENWM